MTYLDTHIVAWLFGGHLRKLSREAAREIDKADTLLISPVVELELAYLHRRERLKEDPATILGSLRARIGLNLCDLPFAMVSHEAVALTWTEDPFDRLITAQAAATRSRLVTSDTTILTHYLHAIW